MRKVALGLALSGVIASQAHAVGLGEIRTHSSLNQPLSANIELVETTASDIDDIQVALAPRAVFEQVGINRSQLLDQLEFIPTIENGVPTIKVVSLQPIQEPFLNFVLEVTWANGKLLREYTVLLDPPVFSDTQYAAAPVVPAQPEVAPLETLPEVIETPVPQEELAPLPEVAVTQPVFSEPEVVSGVAGGLDPFVSVPEVVSAPTEITSESEALMYEGLETYPVEEIAGLPEPVVVSEAEIAAELNQPVAEGIDPFLPAGALPDPEILAFESAPEARYEDYPLEETFALEEQAVEFVDPAAGTEEVFVAQSELSPAEAEIESIFVEQAAPVASVAPPAATTDSYKVQRGDTLSRIASKVGVPGALNKTMVALLQENPEAFINNNMNLVRAGYILRVPDADAINGISEREALSLIASQNSAWKEYRAKVADVAAPQFDGSRFAGIADLENRIPTDAGEQEIVREDSTESVADDAPEAGIEDLAKAPTDLEILVPEGEGDSIEGTDKTGTGAIGNLERELSLAKEQLESQTQQNAELRSRVAELESLLESKNRLIELKNEQLADLQEQSTEESVAAEAAGKVEEAAQEAKDVAMSAADAVKDSAKGLLPKTGVEQEAPVVEEPEKAVESKPAAEEIKTAVKEAAPEKESTTYEEPSMLDDLKNDPNMLMKAGFGGLLVAALGWLLLRRKEDKDDESSEEVIVTAPEPVLKDDDSEIAASSLVDSDADDEKETSLFDTESAAANLTEGDDLDDSSVDAEEVLDSTGVEASGDDAEDEVMSEANVYLAYGLQDQAVDLLKPVVESQPERVDYAVKLAEAYHSTGDKDSFEALALQVKDRIGDTEGNEDWARISAWGKDLLPGSSLFESSETAISEGVESVVSDVDVEELDVSDLGESLEENSLEEIGSEVSETDLVEEIIADEIDVSDAESLSIDADELDLGDLESPDQVGEIDLKELDDLEVELATEADDAVDSVEELNDDLISADLSADDGLDLEDLVMEEADDVLQTSEIDEISADLGDAASTLSMSLDDDLNLDTLVGDDESLTVFSAGEDEVSTKLDLAKAYLDMGDDEGAREALDEVINTGTEEQRNEAAKLKSQLDA